MISVYVHIPFCLKKCDYCDFFSIPVEKKDVPHQNYLAAIRRQLEHDVCEPGLSGRQVGTVYFGGGTPSLMPPGFFETVLSQLRRFFILNDDVEVSCEVNPATVDHLWFGNVKDYGITRISIGVQSFKPHLLAVLGRLHSAEDAKRAITWARQAGFDNISIDLMFGIPGQSVQELNEDLHTAMSFDPWHICAYGLTLEEGTPLNQRLRGTRGEVSGNQDALPEDEIIRQMRAVAQLLSSRGWRRYEISNYARPGSECRHNLNYWHYGQYLGLGAGATSFIRTNVPTYQRTVFGRRWTQARNVSEYLAGGSEIVEAEDIEFKTAMAEFCFLGLRTSEGIDPERFGHLFGVPFDSVYGQKLAPLVAGGLIRQGGGRITLTPRGIELSNQVFANFILFD